MLSPSGHEVGPFLSIEQAALSQVVTEESRTHVFAWYTLTGSVATALGALAAGGTTRLLQDAALTSFNSYRAVVIGYAVLGVVLAGVFARLSRQTEVTRLEGHPAGASVASATGLHQSRPVVLKLSALFAMDAFGGGFIVQAFTAYWFHLRFGVEPASLGAIFFWGNILAGISALLGGRGWPHASAW